MCLQDIKIAKSQETRSSSTICPTGASTQVAGQANNRVGIRFAITSFAGAIGNMASFVQYVGDSVPVGVGFLGAGTDYVELSLEENSHFVKGPFLVQNVSGANITIGVTEILQNVNPESVL